MEKVTDYKYSKIDVSKLGFIPVDSAIGEDGAILVGEADKLARKVKQSYFAKEPGYSTKWYKDNADLVEAYHDHHKVVPDKKMVTINGKIEPVNYQTRECIVPGCTNELYAHREGEFFCMCHSYQWHDILFSVREDNIRERQRKMQPKYPIQAKLF